jgi:hypothetical protein
MFKTYLWGMFVKRLSTTKCDKIHSNKSFKFGHTSSRGWAWAIDQHNIYKRLICSTSKSDLSSTTKCDQNCQCECSILLTPFSTEVWWLNIDIREYIECSLAQPACLVLADWLCRQPLLSCGTTIRCKKPTILLYCLKHSFKFKLWSLESI